MQAVWRLVVLWLLLAIGTVQAQDTQVPFCNGTEIIDAPLGSRLKQFEKYPGFLQASVFQVDSTYVMEVLYKPASVILRERQPLSAPERQTLCEEVLRLQAAGAKPDLVQDGRAELVSTSVLSSLLYYGWAVPAALNVQNGRAFLASYMFINGAGFFVPFLSTRNGTVTKGMGRAYAAGTGMGVVHGWALTLALKGIEIDARTGLGVSVVTSLGEGIAGYHLARTRNLSLGHVDLMSSGGAWGGFYGLLFPFFLDSRTFRTYGTSALIGSGAGILYGNRLASRLPIADGDSRVISNVGVLGFMLGTAALVTLEPESEKTILGVMILGSAAGLKLGLMKAIRFDYTEGEGTLIGLGSIAGGLTGLGSVYVISENAPAEAYFWAAGLGATGGFLLTDYLVRSRQVSRRLGNLRIHLNPLALRSSLRPAAGQQATSHLSAQPQLLRLSYRF